MSIEGFFSQTKIVKCDVQPGPAIGLLLFLIYINNLTNVIEEYIGHHFANDANFMAIKNPLVISDVINNDLKLVTDWLKANKLFQNESKQNYV